MLLDEVCSDTAEERCTTEKRNDLLGPEPTTEPVTSCLGVLVPPTQKTEIKGPTTRSKIRRAATVFQESFRTPTATRSSADVSRLSRLSRSAGKDQPEPAGKRTSTALRPRSCATATSATPTVPGTPMTPT